jgi:Acetyltransferase (GNAT) domain
VDLTETRLFRTGSTYASHGETYRLAVLYGQELDVLAPLFRDVFGSERFTPEWIRRKYAWEWDGTRAFACAAFAENGQPAAAVGVLPWPFRHGERVELAAQIGESSTATEYRGRGLFVRVVELAHEVCDAVGMSFVIRFPNELSFPITISKLGYTHLGDLVEFQQPVRTVWVERAARRAGLGSPYDRRVERVTSPFAESDPGLMSSVLAEGHAGVERNPAFLAYKSAFGGSRVLSLEGARVWLAVRHGLLVGDVAAESDAELGRTLDSLARLARRLGAHRVLFQASGDIRLSRVLATRLQEAGRRPVAYLDLRSRIPSEALRFTLGDIDTF